MLHIVNGDAVGNMLKQGIVQGEVLVWREIYSSGPIFEDLTGTEERVKRSLVLESTLGVPANTYIAACEEQESKLRDYTRYDEVVLWFEHDLFDQSMLAFLLHAFKRNSPGRTKLSLLCIGEYPGIEPFHGLGQLTPAQLGTLSGTWRTIGKREIELGSELWQAYASSDPTHLADLLEMKKSELTASGLPFAYEAFMAHLSRLPSVENGLGIVEQTTLEAIEAGAHTPLELFRQVTDILHVLGMGDLEYFKYLSTMTAGDHPLLHIDGAQGFVELRQIPEFLSRHVTLTEDGKQIRNGAADRVLVQGIDEWYGGLHMRGHEVSWRWDRSTGRPVRNKTGL
ncbi:DUF1835 domain-containing protein [Paenibacillus sp. sgz5001063]|uniref:DUF1835 domain-containing protein n=1 Tax=Paenibacillus sp. sgz5001063 TaxID=3242474 RepID=UPI0036D22940